MNDLILSKSNIARYTSKFMENKCDEATAIAKALALESYARLCLKI